MMLHSQREDDLHWIKSGFFVDPEKKIFEWGQDGEVENYVYVLDFSEKGSALWVVQDMADITETDRILLSTQSRKYKT